MITRDNIREVFDGISKEQLDKAMDYKCDYVTLEVDGYGNIYLFPAKSFVKAEKQMEQVGGIVCDKDDLLRLFKESGSTNMNFKEYV